MGHWGVGALELQCSISPVLQCSNAPMLQHLFLVSDMMLENQLSQSLALKLIRMGGDRKTPPILLSPKASLWKTVDR